MPRYLGSKKIVYLFLEAGADVFIRITRNYNVAGEVKTHSMVLTAVATNELITPSFHGSH